MRRRHVLGFTATGIIGLPGCLSQSDSSESEPDADILAGPSGRLVFEPAAVTISVGDSLTWMFASSGHNISCIPRLTEQVHLPATADPFASHDRGSPRQLDPHGATYTHRFETPGHYVYVCIPHVSDGMIGEITVTESD